MELKFKVDTKHRKDWFTEVSFSHPAKMSLPLQLWIIGNYTKAGETILDPMAGSGTILVACSLGRNVIAVELESKFIGIMKGNFEKIKQRGVQLGYTFGQAQIIQGDARNLGGLVDKIITSPPYAEAQIGDDRKSHNLTIQGIGRENGKRRGRSLVNYHLSSESNPDNISNLPYGSIDKIVTSPPFGGAEASDDRKTFNDTHHNIGQGSLKTHHYEKDNLGNLKYGNIDAVVTSPPYEACVSQGEGPGATTIKRKNARASSQPNYSEASNNIGNLKSSSYLEAMLQVYQNCYTVLRPGGLMILVVKNFLRDQKEVGLRGDTVQLCEQAGFSYLEEHHRILPSQSFWRVIYKKKYPSAPVIDREYVLVFRK